MQDPDKRSGEHLNPLSIRYAALTQNGNRAEKAAYKMDLSRVKNLHELSCDMLSLSFLENEEEIYTLNDLREMY